ncbi:GNAT family N-acetyltransferase [Mesobacillus subterraneus]|uniref:GNAT family N-acetyltransferase n=1 Tax=Mesobacillus subterraneus TaxID=285983 RepID=A0A427TWT6_9BACI|nr:GNAT family N-acetyltransferase [Mesobacillus subterraneus]RSD28810.1 GNAT family N-acetyltransferase [Mesobacillus subterraneus]
MIYKNNAAGISAGMLEGFFVGWPDAPDTETHIQLLKKSDKVIIAVDEEANRVIGFITAITDHTLSAYIPFLEVLPAYHNKGVGKELVSRMLKELEGTYMIDLMCDENLQPYYEQMGMIKSSGMIIRNYQNQSGKN